MAWQAYIDSSLLNTGAVHQVAIFDLHKKLLASSMGFMVLPSEVDAIVGIISAGGTGQNVVNARIKGFTVAGTQYFAVKSDARSLYGARGKEGVVIVKTTRAIIITCFPESSSLYQAAQCVEQLGDYLISVGQ